MPEALPPLPRQQHAQQAQRSQQEVPLQSALSITTLAAWLPKTSPLGHCDVAQ